MCTGAHIMPVCCLLMSHECPAEEKVLDESIKKMADGVGFEPTRRFHVCRFSRRIECLMDNGQQQNISMKSMS